MAAADELRAHLAVLYPRETLDQIRHVHQQRSELLHVISVAPHDLLNGIHTSLQGAGTSVRPVSDTDA
jgi:hypothetical protein